MGLGAAFACSVFTTGCVESVSEDCSKPENAAWCNGESSSTEVGDVCEELWAAPATGQGITITLRNDRASTVFVPWAVSGCTWEPLTMWVNGERWLWDAANAYIPSCELLFESECGYGCSDGPANMLRLEPGAEWPISWDGYAYAPMALDPACAAEQSCAEGAMCWAGRQLEAETVEARLRIATDCTLESCECSGDACLLTQDSLSIGGIEADELSLMLTYDGSDVVLAIPEP